MMMQIMTSQRTRIQAINNLLDKIKIAVRKDAFGNVAGGPSVIKMTDLKTENPYSIGVPMDYDCNIQAKDPNDVQFEIAMVRQDGSYDILERRQTSNDVVSFFVKIQA